MTKPSEPAFKGTLFIQHGSVSSSTFEELRHLLPDICVEECNDVEAIRLIPTDKMSQRLYIATQLAAGDIQWIKAMGKDELIKRITIYYRIADVLIEGEHATTEGKEKEG